MTSFLFWNLQKKDLSIQIANLAICHSIDIIMLAECAYPQSILQALNQDILAYEHSPGIRCKNIQIFVKFSRNLIKPVFETDRLTIRSLELPQKHKILLAVIHFQSKLYWSDSEQEQKCVLLATDIIQAEKNAGHSNTIFVGDLNMNPFETGVISAFGLHGVMSKQIALKQKRCVAGQDYPYFYNPMWNLLGDIPEPPGTYYYSSGGRPNVYFWNIFDQVLVRPSLVQHFEDASLKILTSDGNSNFLNKSSVPDKKRFSDHLPIFFKMNLPVK